MIRMIPRSFAATQLFVTAFMPMGTPTFGVRASGFEEYYESIVEKGGGCGFADKSNCTIAIVKNGVSEWWVQVKAGNRTGWVLAYKHAGDTKWDGGNFGPLCGLDWRSTASVLTNASLLASVKRDPGASRHLPLNIDYSSLTITVRFPRS